MEINTCQLHISMVDAEIGAMDRLLHAVNPADYPELRKLFETFGIK